MSIIITPPTAEHVLHLEQGFFTDGSPDYYRRVVDDEAMFVIPGMGRVTKQQCIDIAASSVPWTSETIDHVETVQLADHVLGLTYHVVAEREGQDPYEAWMSSVWRRTDGHWRLVMTQHSPVIRH